MCLCVCLYLHGNIHYLRLRILRDILVSCFSITIDPVTKKFAQLDNCGLTVYTHWYAGGRTSREHKIILLSQASFFTSSSMSNLSTK